MTPQLTLVLVQGRRSMIAWGWVCVVNASICAIVIGAMLSIDRNPACSTVYATKRAMRAIEQGVVAYQTDHTDACPRSVDDLVAQHYLTRSPKDRYGEPLVFTCPGVHNKDGADIVSKGRDRIFGTADDVKSWEL